MGSPNPANRFSLTIDGNIDLGFWSSVSGLDVNWSVAEYRAGDTGNAQPAPAKYSDIQLARAACADTVKVQAWLKSR